MLWVGLSFIASLSRAGSRVANQYFQLPGLYLVLWIKVLITLYLLPFMFFITWPTEPLFYLFLIAQAPLVVFQDKKTFDLTAAHGGGVVSRIEPLSVVLLFFMWLAISPTFLQESINSPVQLSLTALTIALIAYFAMRMRKCTINLTVLKQMIPLVFTTAIVSVLGKISIDYAEFDSAVFVYVFVQSIAMLVCALAFNKKEKSIDIANFFDGRKFRCAMLLSLIMLVTILSRVYAFRYVDNPAYVNAIVLTAPFWILLFYKLVKHEEKGDLFSGLGIVCCAIILTVLVA